ncbi:MAG: TonB-dependent receptor [Acidimicrobiia bacterium]|nr:TonB-dependent receptor [Acidimicrobiia bacterium]
MTHRCWGLPSRLGRAAMLGLALLPSSAWAQTASTGAIAGVARDTTGAVLPGVTVEAASPALIEKVRIAVTDEQGNYKIVDLRPGTYSVTFTLAGFASYKREGIELTSGFTAAANADMKVGSLEETVTVTGASPVVDIQSARQQRVLSREILDGIPSGKTLQGFVALTLGAVGLATQQDVGGNKGDGLGGFGYHGSRSTDQRLTQDGMLFTGIGGAANVRNIMINQVFVQETTVETRGAGAENEAGGAHINVVPKDGGNTFSTVLTANGAGSSLQADNTSAALKARGAVPQVSVKRLFDAGGGLGGPISRDRLWFYTAHRWWSTQSFLPGSYYNKNQGKYIGDPDSGVSRYEADLSRPAFQDIKNEDHSVRLTFQATPKNKFTFSTSLQNNCNCNLGTGPSAPEAFWRPTYWPISLSQSTWSRPATNRFLIDAGATFLFNDFWGKPMPEVSPRDIAIVELTTGAAYNARTISLWLADYGKRNFTNQFNSRFAIHYVTGSHAVKAGFTYLQGWQHYNIYLNDRPMQYQFRNGVPISLTQWASPLVARSRFNPNMGVFAQDQWTIRRLTLDLGVRFDYLNAINPQKEIPAGPFVPARNFPEVRGAPRWTDISPRLGAAYDLFGNGKTAVKTALGRYVELANAWGLTYQAHPAASIAISGNRLWNDANGNYVPDCNLLNNLANGECGQSSTATLGQLNPINRYDDDMLKGFGHRGYNWQMSASLQHELRPNLALNAGYFRTWFGNFSVSDNLAVTPADFDPFCVTSPTDSRLGAASGRQLCGFYDVRPSKLGQLNNVITRFKNYGKRTEVYNGFDVSLNARFGDGGLLQGGMSTGQTTFNSCVTIDSPQASLPGFCDFKLPFEGQTQYKVAFIYPLPLDIKASGTYQNLPGIPLAATLVVLSPQVAPTLGRNLASGVAILNILEPNTIFEERLSQFDLRLTKVFSMGRARIQGMFDVYNMFNASTVLGLNTRYGASWLQPTTILGGRLFKFGAQVDF